MRFAGNIQLRGYSLIEVIFYIAIFSLVSGGSVLMIFSLQRQVFEYRTNQALTRNATTIMERMLVDLRAANTVSGGTFGSSPGTLTLTDGATSTAYALTSGNITVATNGGTAVALNGAPVSASSLQFDQFDNGKTKAVKVSFTLSATVGGVTVTENFYNTAVLLGSYD